ncbi:MAG: aminoacyl-histidine dipeptidase [Crocinitomicaceae bacterium]|nr:aminoacyl-histidine dipeptidase [Crocinitomicaceae bacterium]
MSISDLNPVSLWSNFENLNKVPRPSKKEERIIQFMVDFGNQLGLETNIDNIKNVIIKKPASPGMEDRKTIILQSHIDMVHQKNADTIFDFEKEGIKMYIDEDWVKAKGTTLGADNGIGVAAIMGVLASTDIDHPPIEALFTIDEETGMTGAKHMEGNMFNGEILLNLDTEDDDELSIGCAGGIDTNTKYTYSEISIDDSFVLKKVSIRGLLGGHSGMDIHKGRGNANKWMSRMLFSLSNSLSFQLVSFHGGSLRNAIPREADAVIAISLSNEKNLEQAIVNISDTLHEEYASIEPNFKISISKTEKLNKAVNPIDQNKIIKTLCSLHNGVFRMSPEFDGLVETSSSLAKIELSNGIFSTQSLQRSSVESTKDEIAMTIRCAFENMGCEVVQEGDYPGWRPDSESEILKIMEDLYTELFNEKPNVKACHAGLECGILGKHLPGVDMISFGPNIRAAHSPDEKVQISSVQKFWKFYLETLKRIPKK